MRVNRYKPAIRRDLILSAAVEVARRPGGWGKLTRQAIAVEAGVSDGLVSRYLGDMSDARRAIMKEAYDKRISEIIFQSVTAHDGYAVKKSSSSKSIKQALRSLLQDL